MEIQHLVDAVAPLLREPAAEEDFVYGLAAFPATGTDVMINVDPELEDRADVEVPDLVARVGAFLALSPEQWDALVTRTVTEIEEAAGEVAVPVALREDLDLTSVVVFIDAVLLSFIAPLQLPDGIVRVQLDADLAFEDIEVQIEDGTETVTFDTMDDLLDHISRED